MVSPDRARTRLSIRRRRARVPRAGVQRGRQRHDLQRLHRRVPAEGAVAAGGAGADADLVEPEPRPDRPGLDGPGQHAVLRAVREQGRRCGDPEGDHAAHVRVPHRPRERELRVLGAGLPDLRGGDLQREQPRDGDGQRQHGAVAAGVDPELGIRLRRNAEPGRHLAAHVHDQLGGIDRRGALSGAREEGTVAASGGAVPYDPVALEIVHGHARASPRRPVGVGVPRGGVRRGGGHHLLDVLGERVRMRGADADQRDRFHDDVHPHRCAAQPGGGDESDGRGDEAVHVRAVRSAGERELRAGAGLHGPCHRRRDGAELHAAAVFRSGGGEVPGYRSSDGADQWRYAALQPLCLRLRQSIQVHRSGWTLSAMSMGYSDRCWNQLGSTTCGWGGII